MIKLTTIQTQRTILAPLMQQSINILLLPLAELHLAIEQELQSNPLLEVEENTANSPNATQEESMQEKMNLYNKQRDSLRPLKTADDETLEDRPISREQTLEEQLMLQLQMDFTDPLELSIGELIIGNLDEDGYLTLNCEEISRILNLKNTKKVETVLGVIHSYEPLGVASRSLGECLTIQANAIYNGHSKILSQIIENHLEELSRKKYSSIAKALGISSEKVQDAAHKIALLEPKPARNYRPIPGNTYFNADVIIRKDPENGYQVSINKEGIPSLYINSTYKRALKDPNLKPEEKTFIREKLNQAAQFIKSIELRGHTIRKIAEIILEKQKEYFEGNPHSLVPLTLKDVAEAINRNESTISRAIQNKYVETPQGMLPLRFFFSQGLPGQGNRTVCSRGLKEEIKDLVDNEDKNSPLCDQEIQNYFSQKGLLVARRTISKYRTALQIAPSHLRRTI